MEADPNDAVALYTRARSLDRLAEIERSNSRLELAIFAYRSVLDIEHVPEQLFRLAADRCIDRMRFRGWFRYIVFYLSSESLTSHFVYLGRI